ncbi:UDP-glucose 4-epimerase [Paenibacillus plantiphilus]|uniref:UDP-glucose 4-epimerase n=1 Tax=Paenibacillus plantiphilus TaxID=2905650 RepID=A0ABM9BRL4_9BACL|nr:NAD-dependent epimerase/dehydratase family protein [Paenibacillus plantiphilus]CAH1193359.1 UDP-glucose 4-epimerase [Paenibacillus plantiphilus]
MRILITGGAGFIGSNIADACKKDGHEILIVDNFSTGLEKNLEYGHQCVRIDINADEMQQVFRDFKPEVVIHNAAQVSVGRSLKEPLLDQEINIRGTLNILQGCVDNGVRKIIYPSSAAVYGLPSYLPIKESHTINPESFYGITKYTPELYIKSFNKLYGLDYTILRYSNVYGPRQDPRGEGGVIAIFLDKISRGERPVVLGDGYQTRDFIFIDDVVNANLASLCLGSQGTVNVSSNTSVSLNELLNILGEIVGNSLSPIYEEERPGDIRDSQLDNSCAIQMLSWTPQIDLKTGLSNTLIYYNKSRKVLL